MYRQEPREDTVVKSALRKESLALSCLWVLSLLCLCLLFAVPLPAQTSTAASASSNINPPAFDFSDGFYTENGINLTQLNSPAGARFGLFRQTGSPARPGQQNWVIDNSNTDPTRNNVKILATTGGYDTYGNPTEFINIIAFLNDVSYFDTGHQAGQRMHDMAESFQVYTPLRQTRNGKVTFQPCTTGGTAITTNNLGVTFPDNVSTNCFPIDFASTNLSSDKFFDSGEDAYFCEDLIGIWHITYVFYTAQAFTPAGRQQVQAVIAADTDPSARNLGTNLDGLPIVNSPHLLDALEAQGLMDEFNLPEDGTQGTVWLICPRIQDPRFGGIDQRAFLDAVFRTNGIPLDLKIAANFLTLQIAGNYLIKPVFPAEPPNGPGLDPPPALPGPLAGPFGPFNGGPDGDNSNFPDLPQPIFPFPQQ